MLQSSESLVLMLQVKHEKVKSHQKSRIGLVQRKDQTREDQIGFHKEVQ